jgi:CDP-diglyceride synthetase
LAGRSGKTKVRMRISNRLTWSLFLASSIGLVVLSVAFHQRGWGIFLERSTSGRHLPLGILVVLCAAVWVIAVIALLFGKRVPRPKAEAERPPSPEDERWLE